MRVMVARGAVEIHDFRAVMVVDDPSVGEQVVKNFAADAALLHAHAGVAGEFGGVHAGKYGQWQAQGVSLRAGKQENAAVVGAGCGQAFSQSMRSGTACMPSPKLALVSPS